MYFFSTAYRLEVDQGFRFQAQEVPGILPQDMAEKCRPQVPSSFASLLGT
jgi:hypothetical protein